ncbi:hypothetical protein AK830_g2606 [Neonectria ditissima]|uniref:Transcription factor domain-containing protein n=1 Tax=Neonectria ditissima TaxID=78410 RepID=A0A0P7BAX3_9HYPO|nr:hypothetical protein AK830_g2606 [Neonectria ditissima]
MHLTSTSAMEFCFIDNNKPLDRHSQKVLRSYAMKGKNLGKSVPARGHKWRQRESETGSGQERAKSDGLTKLSGLTNAENGRLLLPKTSTPNSCNTSTTMSRPQNWFSGAELFYFTTPEPITPSSRYLIHEFFHCGLAMTGAHISRHLGRRDASLESTRHFTEAMRLLRRELSTSSTPQDSSLAVIISLAIHATLTGAADESRMHLLGLKHVVDLRPGGLAALCAGAPEVGNKVRRADLNLALMVGTPTLFGSQPSPLPATLHVVPLNGQTSSITLPDGLGDISPALQPVTRDVFALCSYAGCAQLGAFQYQDMVLSIFQRLADYAPLGGPRPSSQLDDKAGMLYIALRDVPNTA